MDLTSVDVQRGRDHAIGTYNQLRSKFGLSRAKSFLDLKNTTTVPLIQRIQLVYRHVEDIDLFVGGMTEMPLTKGASKVGILGPLFSAMVRKQFELLQKGDRFFYDSGNSEYYSGSFTLGTIVAFKVLNTLNL